LTTPSIATSTDCIGAVHTFSVGELGQGGYSGPSNSSQVANTGSNLLTVNSVVSMGQYLSEQPTNAYTAPASSNMHTMWRCRTTLDGPCHFHRHR
jgi:hypothetical protein